MMSDCLCRIMIGKNIKSQIDESKSEVMDRQMSITVNVRADKTSVHMQYWNNYQSQRYFFIGNELKR